MRPAVADGKRKLERTCPRVEFPDRFTCAEKKFHVTEIKGLVLDELIDVFVHGIEYVVISFRPPVGNDKRITVVDVVSCVALGGRGAFS